MSGFFYTIFWMIIGYLLFKTFVNRNLLRFSWALLSEVFKRRKIQVDDAVFMDKGIKNKSVTKTEKFVLSVASLEHERSKHLIKELTLKAYLAKIWNINLKEENVKERTIYVLQQLLSEGSISFLFRNIQFSNEVTVQDLVAFDASRFAELLFQVIYLDILEEEEAWGLLFLNAQRVQDSFSNWKAFNDAYCKGLTLHQFVKLEEEAQENYVFKDELQKNRVLFDRKETWLEEDVFREFKIEKEI